MTTEDARSRTGPSLFQPTSPFPSPSSSFVPPPPQEAHEFAHKTTTRMAAAKQSSSRRTSEAERPAQPPQATDPGPSSSTLQALDSAKRFSAESAHSLPSSSRPAPPSPAPSRHSSLLHGSNARQRLSTLSIVSSTHRSSINKPNKPTIKIRDFAFPTADERHTGDGPLARRFSTTSSRSSSSHDEEDYDESPYVSDSEQDQFVPGMYRALYAFEPEGTAEMALAEDQHVRVLGRGGGVGWVVVLKPDGAEQALVPEDYLELVQADDDEDEDDEQSVGGTTEVPRTPRPVS